MKKLILLFVLTAILSCSNEDQNVSKDVSASSSSASVFDGKMLSYGSKESFIKEYSELSGLKSEKDIQNWISNKGLESLLNISNDSIEMENDVLSDSRIIYSNALKAILNSESKLKIEEKTIWLHERNFYLLSENDIDKSSEELILIKDKLEIYGNLLSVSNSKTDTKLGLTARQTVVNENRVKTYVVNLTSNRRNVIDLFNETIVINNQISSSKMYLRFTLQYKSCSFWRCTWKNDTETGWKIAFNNLDPGVTYPWSWVFDSSNVGLMMVGQNTFLLSNLVIKPMLPDYQYPNFYVSGSITWMYSLSPNTFPQAISWY